MTIMYMFMQVALGDPEGMEWVRDRLSKQFEWDMNKII